MAHVTCHGALCQSCLLFVWKNNFWQLSTLWFRPCLRWVLNQHISPLVSGLLAFETMPSADQDLDVDRVMSVSPFQGQLPVSSGSGSGHFISAEFSQFLNISADTRTCRGRVQIWLDRFAFVTASAGLAISSWNPDTSFWLFQDQTSNSQVPKPGKSRVLTQENTSDPRRPRSGWWTENIGPFNAL